MKKDCTGCINVAAGTTGERRQREDRRSWPRRVKDQTIPPDKIYVCKPALTVLEHHLGNSVLLLRAYIKKQELAADASGATPDPHLVAANAAVNRIAAVKVALGTCYYAELECPKAHITPWRAFLLRFVERIS